MQHWRNKSLALVSKGSFTRPDGLAGLAEARRLHEGQFWTPSPVAESVWKAVLPLIDRSISAKGEKVTVLDSSIGSGSLVQFCDPKRHIILGCEKDGDTYDAVTADLDEAGFEKIFRFGSMHSLRFQGVGVALINPPFSLMFDGPDITHFSTNSYGRYGPFTQARSHVFAVSQALEASEVVVALVPFGFLQEANQIAEWENRLWGRFLLPSNSFASESVNYDIGILVFGPAGSGQIGEVSQWDIQTPPLLPLWDISPKGQRSPKIISNDDEISISGIITGNREVRISLNGRKIILGFECAFTKAVVLNKLLGLRIQRSDDLRLPRGYKWRGDVFSDVELFLAQDDPVDAMMDFAQQIRGMGGKPVFAPGLLEFLSKRKRLRNRESIPFERWVFETSDRVALSNCLEAGQFKGTAQRHFLCDPSSWGAPAIPKGTEVNFTQVDDDNAKFTFRGQEFTVNMLRIRDSFRIHAETDTGSRWRKLHDGKSPHTKAIIENERKKAVSLGISEWLWDFQFKDLLELRTVRGCVLGYHMGLGKTRMALALCLMGGARNLIVVEAHLVDEFLDEIKKVGIDPDQFNLIDRPERLSDLRKINIITYSRLGKAVSRTNKKTYASYLRHRISTLVADEAHCVRNLQTNRTCGLYQVSAKRRYGMTGTPVANYPRDLLPLAVWTCGEGTAAQPYGYHRPYLNPSLFQDSRNVARGVDQFRNDFVTLEWCTNEFSDEMNSGAKREIPKIKNLTAYRNFASRIIKRRVQGEPEVEKYIRLPKVEFFTHTSKWDSDHFDFYKKVSDDFIHFYKKGRDNSRNVNLLAIIQRINAVIFAANYPARGIDRIGGFYGKTTKERDIVAQIQDFTEKGHKTILFARSPGILNRMKRFCQANGIKAEVCHGEIPQAQRSRTIAAFKAGKIDVLLGSFGVTQSGLNLYQADRVIFFQRDWTSKTERQALCRVLRPQQKKPVEVHFWHLKGSIDEYQAQMAEHKGDASDSGLDYAEPEFQDSEFLHLDTIFGRFVKDIEDGSLSRSFIENDGVSSAA